MNKSEFGKRLKIARKQKKMTQVELADAIEKKEATVRKYENGTIEPPWNVIEELAKALDVSPFDLTVDIEKLRSDVKLTEEIQKVFGFEVPELLNDYSNLNPEGKTKACEYISDLTLIEYYQKKQEEPLPDKTENGSKVRNHENK